MWIAYLEKDPYELPVCVEESLTAMSWKLKIARSAVSTSAKNHVARRGYFFEQIMIDEEEDLQ